MKLFVPAYVLDTSLNVYYSQPTISTMIFNHGNGPGPSRDASLSGHMTASQKNQIHALGYVDTGHASVPLSRVKQQIDAWYSRYTCALDGIYFDNVDGNSGRDNTLKTNYYTLASQYVRNQQSGSAINHVSFGCGGLFPESYLTLCNTISVWEYPYNGSMNTFPKKSNLSPWVYDVQKYGYGAERFIGWLYGGTANPDIKTTRAFVDACHDNNIGNTFVVDHPSYSTLISLPLLADMIPYVAGK